MKTYLGKLLIILFFLSGCGLIPCDDCDQSSHATNIFIENKSDEYLIMYFKDVFPPDNDDLYDTLKLNPNERAFVSNIPSSYDAVLGAISPYGNYGKSIVISGSDTLLFTNGIDEHGVYDSTVCEDRLNPLCKENYKVILETETKREELFIFNP